MARKRRKSTSPGFPFIDPAGVVVHGNRFLRANVSGHIARYYSENIHITRSIDEQLCKMSAKWCALPQERRYGLIHTGLGVKWLFDLAENDQLK